MAASWHSSLSHTLRSLPAPSVAAAIRLPPQWLPSALDYGAYFDLHLSAVSADPAETEAVRDSALSWLAHRFPARSDRSTPQPGPKGLCIQALGESDFTGAETARLKRWLDTDAQQPLCLQSPDPERLQNAALVLEQAWTVLGAVAPELRDEIAIISPQVLLARSADPSGGRFGGASSFCLWGCVALNADVLEDAWDGFSSLVHESAHGLLFAQARRQPLVRNAPDEHYASPLRTDPRPMDGIFHAAFVSAREVWAFRQALVHPGALPGDSSDPSRAGLRQRLQDRENAFRACDSQLTRWGQLTDLGAAILQECREQLDALPEEPAENARFTRGSTTRRPTSPPPPHPAATASWAGADPAPAANAGIAPGCGS